MISDTQCTWASFSGPWTRKWMIQETYSRQAEAIEVGSESVCRTPHTWLWDLQLAASKSPQGSSLGTQGPISSISMPLGLSQLAWRIPPWLEVTVTLCSFRFTIEECGTLHSHPLGFLARTCPSGQWQDMPSRHGLQFLIKQNCSPHHSPCILELVAYGGRFEHSGIMTVMVMI